MWPNIIKGVDGSKRAFTIAEVLLSVVIAFFVVASAWVVYTVSAQWWGEMGPRLDLQKAARMALLSAIEGAPDSTAGSYAVGATTYTRRNGFAWSTRYPTFSSDKKTISFGLVPDSSNARQFYYGTYNGQGVLYYKDNGGTSHRLDNTIGISDIKFEKFVDNGGLAHDNIIKVTATAEKDVYGTRRDSPFHVKVVYTDTVYLRNAL